ncbi:MAG: hypothetical protein HYX63_15470 [Gammaproteobacteria bacterium]|nr:hypothetical protein [Gammaproteobacteria bacterium]
MPAPDEERRLLAILSGDVVGYSRLMTADESATIVMLAAARDAIGHAVLAHHGRIVDFTGDNFLAEFSSAVHAVYAALAIQRAIAVRTADVPTAQRMVFRLGAHLGDVRIVGERLYGNGVNIAARLEGLAPAGGICLSRQFYEQVEAQISISVRDLGPQTLKNVSQRVHAYAIDPDALSERPLVNAGGANAPLASQAAVVVGIPTIAVLSFTNLSTDPEHEYLVEGMTADITSGLSCDRRFAIISHGSAKAFKGETRDVTEIGKLLGANYVVTGAVRRLGERLRITAALVEVATRNEIWSGREDRTLAEIFEVFDDVIEALVTALASHLKLAEDIRHRRRPPEQLDAWALVARASLAYFTMGTVSATEGLRMVERALELEPDYAYAWAIFGFLTALKFPSGRSTDRAADVETSLAATRRALALDPHDPWALTAHAAAMQYAGQAAQSLGYLVRSLRANPSDVLTHCYYGRGLMFSGEPERALAHFARFKRLNPNDPGAHQAAMYHAIAIVFARRWVEAEVIARDAVTASGGRNPWSWTMLAIALGALGRETEARVAIADVLRGAPHWSREFVETFLVTCQSDHSLVTPLLEILRTIWPDH